MFLNCEVGECLSAHWKDTEYSREPIATMGGFGNEISSLKGQEHSVAILRKKKPYAYREMETRRYYSTVLLVTLVVDPTSPTLSY